MTSPLRIRPDEPLKGLVNRHPLLVEYFVKKTGGELDLSRTVQEYLQHQPITRSQLEEELRGHLQSALRPNPEDCETLRCRPFPFCPEEVFDVPSGEVLSLLLTIVKNPLDWIRQTVQILLRFVGEQTRGIPTS